MNPIMYDDTTSCADLDDLTTRSMPDILCKELRNSIARRKKDPSNIVAKVQESVETFELSKRLLCERQWPNKVFHHVRWLLMFLAGSGLALMYLLRLSITVTIVKMVNQTALYMMEHPGEDLGDLGQSDWVSTDGEFVWTNFVQSLIINVYFIGYALPQIYLSHWAGQNGFNKPIIISQIVSLICTALIPIAARMNWQLVAVLRFITGLGGAACYPLFIGMIDIWLPSHERMRAIALLQFFGIAGKSLNPLITSYLCSYDWSWAFYGSCMIGTVWLLLWLILARNSPENCWLVSQEELKIIMSERAFKPSNNGASLVPSAPWKKLFLSRNFYILMASYTFYDNTQASFLNFMPTYMRVIMGMHIKSIGQIACLVQSASLLATIWSSELLEFLMVKFRWSGHQARTIVYGIASLGALITWSLPTFVDGGETIIFAINKSLHQATELVLVGTIVDDWGKVGLSGIMFSVYNTISCGICPLFGCTVGLVFDKMGGTEEAWNWLFAWYGFVNSLGFIIFLALKHTLPASPVDLKSKETSLP